MEKGKETTLEIAIVKDDFDFSKIDPKDKTFYLKEKDYKTIETLAKSRNKTFEEMFNQFVMFMVQKKNPNKTIEDILKEVKEVK